MFKGLAAKFAIVLFFSVLIIMIALGSIIFSVQKRAFQNNLDFSQTILLESLRNKGTSMINFMTKIAAESFVSYDFHMLQSYISKAKK